MYIKQYFLIQNCYRGERKKIEVRVVPWWGIGRFEAYITNPQSFLEVIRVF